MLLYVPSPLVFGTSLGPAPGRESFQSVLAETDPFGLERFAGVEHFIPQGGLPRGYVRTKVISIIVRRGFVLTSLGRFVTPGLFFVGSIVGLRRLLVSLFPHGHVHEEPLPREGAHCVSGGPTQAELRYRRGSCSLVLSPRYAAYAFVA